MSDGRTMLLGIGGGTASGKTTLARSLSDYLGDRCLLLSHDRYYHTMPESFRDRVLDYNFDHPDSLDTDQLVRDLARLRAGESADLPVYQYSDHRRAPEIERVEPRPLVLVEGILALSDPRLRALYHHTVYVDAPDDIRLIRRIHRDIRQRSRTVDEVLSQYMRTVRPMHLRYVEPSRSLAQQVLLGTEPVETLMQAVLTVTGLASHTSP